MRCLSDKSCLLQWWTADMTLMRHSQLHVLVCWYHIVSLLSQETSRLAVSGHHSADCNGKCGRCFKN